MLTFNTFTLTLTLLFTLITTLIITIIMMAIFDMAISIITFNITIFQFIIAKFRIFMEATMAFLLALLSSSFQVTITTVQHIGMDMMTIVDMAINIITSIFTVFQFMIAKIKNLMEATMVLLSNSFQVTITTVCRIGMLISKFRRCRHPRSILRRIIYKYRRPRSILRNKEHIFKGRYHERPPELRRRRRMVRFYKIFLQNYDINSYNKKTSSLVEAVQGFIFGSCPIDHWDERRRHQRFRNSHPRKYLHPEKTVQIKLKRRMQFELVENHRRASYFKQIGKKIKMEIELLEYCRQKNVSKLKHTFQESFVVFGFYRLLLLLVLAPPPVVSSCCDNGLDDIAPELPEHQQKQHDDLQQNTPCQPTDDHDVEFKSFQDLPDSDDEDDDGDEDQAVPASKLKHVPSCCDAVDMPDSDDDVADDEAPEQEQQKSSPSNKRTISTLESCECGPPTKRRRIIQQPTSHAKVVAFVGRKVRFNKVLALSYDINKYNKTGSSLVEATNGIEPEQYTMFEFEELRRGQRCQRGTVRYFKYHDLDKNDKLKNQEFEIQVDKELVELLEKRPVRLYRSLRPKRKKRPKHYGKHPKKLKKFVSSLSAVPEGDEEFAFHLENYDDDDDDVTEQEKQHSSKVSSSRTTSDFDVEFGSFQGLPPDDDEDDDVDVDVEFGGLSADLPDSDNEDKVVPAYPPLLAPLVVSSCCVDNENVDDDVPELPEQQQHDDSQQAVPHQQTNNHDVEFEGFRFQNLPDSDDEDDDGDEDEVVPASKLKHDPSCCDADDMQNLPDSNDEEQDFHFDVDEMQDLPDSDDEDDFNVENLSADVPDSDNKVEVVPVHPPRKKGVTLRPKRKKRRIRYGKFSPLPAVPEGEEEHLNDDKAIAPTVTAMAGENFGLSSPPKPPQKPPSKPPSKPPLRRSLRIRLNGLKESGSIVSASGRRRSARILR